MKHLHDCCSDYSKRLTSPCFTRSVDICGHLDHKLITNWSFCQSFRHSSNFVRVQENNNTTRPTMQDPEGFLTKIILIAIYISSCISLNWIDFTIRILQLKRVCENLRMENKNWNIMQRDCNSESFFSRNEVRYSGDDFSF